MDENSGKKEARILGVQDITDIRTLLNSFSKDVT